MKAQTTMKPELIAACGMNCRIQACAERESSPAGYCFECGQFPCRRLKNLDKRYRAKYMMSMVEVHHHRCSECGESFPGGVS